MTYVTEAAQTVETRHIGDAGLVVRIIRVAKPFLPHLIVMQLLALLAAVLTVATPVPLRLVVDSVLDSKPLPGWLTPLTPRWAFEASDGMLWFSLALFVIIGVLRPLRVMAYSFLRVYIAEALMLRLRARMFRHSQTLSLGFHDQKGVADTLYRIDHDARAMEQLTVNGVIPLVGETATMVLMISIMASIDWRLTLVALAISPFMLVAAQVYKRHLRSRWTKTKEIESSVIGVIQETFSNLRVVKAFGQEEREHERYFSRARSAIRAKLRAVILQGTFALLVGVTVVVGTFVVLYVGVRHVQEGTLTLGQFTQVLFYLAMIYRPLEVIGTTAATLQQWMASANRAFSLLEERPEVFERPDAAPIGRARGDIEFRDVSFRYDGSQTILEGVSFRARPGSRVGISGETGSGKTTLISLLTRFYDPSQGAILLDGTDIRDYRLDELRRQFAIVLQDSVLFSGTIAENIAYGRPQASRAEIEEAARLANAHGFISRLEDGYDSQVGERGMKVSGGERQRIALARAFLRDAALLILDEPTSSVDVDTEAIVMEAIERLMEGRTTFMISHRPNTLENCDLRLVLDRGRLARV